MSARGRADALLALRACLTRGGHAGTASRVLRRLIATSAIPVNTDHLPSIQPTKLHARHTALRPIQATACIPSSFGPRMNHRALREQRAGAASNMFYSCEGGVSCHSTFHHRSCSSFRFGLVRGKLSLASPFHINQHLHRLSPSHRISRAHPLSS